MAPPILIVNSIFLTKITETELIDIAKQYLTDFYN